MFGAVIGGLASLGGSLIGSNSQKKTNEANLRINQMNNEFNAAEAERAFRREAEYNDRIRAEDREYNSAAAQVERYREAGLNPTMMMQGQSAGMAQSNGVSSSAASAASAAPQQAYNPNLGMLGNAIEGFLNRKQQKALINEQVNGIRIENQYKAAKIMAEIANTYTDTRSKSAREQLDRTMNNLQHGLFQMQKDEAYSRVRANDETAKLKATENLLMTKELNTFAQKFGEESAIRLSQNALNIVQASKSRQEARTEMYKTLEAQYSAKNLKVSSQILSRQADYLVDKAFKESRSAHIYDIGSLAVSLQNSFKGFLKNF